MVTVGGAQVDARQHLGEHDLHLVGRERGTEATPDTTAKGKEGERAGPGPDEAFGDEARWIAPRVGAPVGEVQGGADTVVPAGRSRPPIMARACRRRETWVATGVSRIDSLITASRYSSCGT